MFGSEFSSFNFEISSVGSQTANLLTDSGRVSRITDAWDSGKAETAAFLRILSNRSLCLT